MGFTIIEDEQIAGLTRAGATSAEKSAYLALSRAHKLPQYPGNPSWCFRPIKEVAEISGYHRDTAAGALRSLCKREFIPGVTVLTRIGGGHRGQATVYADNLWEWAQLTSGKGGSQSPTNQEAKGGSQSPTNQKMKKVGETIEKGRPKTRKVGEKAPKGRSQSPTQNKYPEGVPRRSNAESTVTEGTAMVDVLVSRASVTQQSRTREAFEDWLWSDTGASGQKPGQVSSWHRRLAKNRRADFDATCSELDRIAETRPASDADLSAEDLRTVETARHSYANGYMSEFYAWLALTWNGYRSAAWAEG